MKTHICTLGLAILFCAACPAAARAGDPISGQWAGAAVHQGEELKIEVEIERMGFVATGSIDIPRLGRRGWPFSRVEYSGGDLRLEFGGAPPYVLTGKLNAGEIEGEFRLGDFSCPFHLKRVDRDKPYAEEEVTFAGAGVTLAGTLFLPRGADPFPAVVHMHGSGDTPRWAYRYDADYLARMGVACLIFDKRGNGGSSGDWNDVGFEELAQDGIEAAHYLRTRGEIDPKRIGMMGISQAGWIMPMAASMSRDVAFLVVLSGGPVKVEREGYYNLRTDLETYGLREDAILEILDYAKLDRHVTRTGDRYDDLTAARRTLVQKSWWTGDLLSIVPFPTPPLSPARDWYRRVMDIDHVPIVRSLDIPVLWIFGTADRSFPPLEAADIVKRAKSDLDKDFTIKIFEGANHGLRVPPDEGAAFPFFFHAEGFMKTIEDWLQSEIVESN